MSVSEIVTVPIVLVVLNVVLELVMNVDEAVPVVVIPVSVVVRLDEDVEVAVEWEVDKTDASVVELVPGAGPITVVVVETVRMT